MFRPRIMLCAVLGLSLLSTAALAGKQDDTLRAASNIVPESMDSYFNATREGVVLSQHIWSYLVYRNPQTNAYQGELATSWKWVDDKTIDFDLRQGVKFHNGDTFSADDVVYTINFVANPDNKVVVQQNVDWLASAEKLGDYKVRIHTKAPFPAALEYLSAAVPIYPGKYYQQVGPKGMSEHPVGSGPYRVTQVDLSKIVVMEKFADYFQGGPRPRPTIGKIEFRTIPEQATQLAEILGGGLDWIWRVPPEQAEQLKKVPNLTVSSTESMRIVFLQFAATDKGPNPALHDVRVRQAISYAIDRETMAKTLVGEGAQVLHTMCFHTQFGCTTEGATHYDYNPDKARQLLAQAGYAKGFDLELWTYRDRPQAEAIMNYLRAVGIHATLRATQYAAANNAMRDGTAAFTIRTYGSYGMNDVSATPSAYLRGDADDTAKDPDVIRWLTLGDTTIDPEVRKQDYQKALARAANQALLLPLYTMPNTYAYTNDLDFKPYPDELARFYEARWK